MYFYGFYAQKEKEYSNKVLIELSLKTAKTVKADERFSHVIPFVSKNSGDDLRGFFETLTEVKSAVLLNSYDQLIYVYNQLKPQGSNPLATMAQLMIDDVEVISEDNIIKCDSAASFFDAFLSHSK